MTDIGKRRFSDTDFARLDGNPDALFYSMPRLVTHIDDAACAALSGHYADFLRDGDRVLDVCVELCFTPADDLDAGRSCRTRHEHC